ncbi:MAG TPA: hypothetical protein PLW86_04055 [Rhodocyclaceae bacterium]|nr:hypothetical protein [Rhodocyclaceae bacterium]
MKTRLFGALLVSFAATAQALPIATISAEVDGPIFSSGPTSINVAPGPETLEVSNPGFSYQTTTGIATGDAAGNYGACLLPW